VRKNREFFISRNTSLNFVRKDNFRCTFDLIRMKRNIKLKLELDNEEYTISVPCEIIDVSMPKKEDYGLKALSKHISGYMKIYNIKNTRFWAPTINYMIKDLDDVLFKQSEFPWSDPKIDKRLIRYFISLLFHHIITGLDNNENIITRLGSFKKELKSMVNMIECYMNKKECDPDENQLSRILMGKYIRLSKRINGNKTEQLNFNDFNAKLIKIIQKLIIEINTIIQNMGKVTRAKIQKTYDELVKAHKVENMGG
jgi:hypothetical protein